MKNPLLDFSYTKCLWCALFLSFSQFVMAQTTIKGKIIDSNSGEPLVGATVIVKGTTTGSQTDFDGLFQFTTNQKPPFMIVAGFIGYDSKEIGITSDTKYPLSIKLGSADNLIETVVIKGQSISDKTKARPQEVVTLDPRGIKEATSVNFYDNLGKLKSVDITTTSLLFSVINTRGFNSTSPVRSLQVIDGVDNQAPGLNFSLGNFLGSSELDVQKVDLVVGANSAYYGPNAFNGVIAMETKDPFFSRGLSAQVKTAERNLLDISARWADTIPRLKPGFARFAFKFNVAAIRADDWRAENTNAVDKTVTKTGNAGGWDAVNTYGDEYNTGMDYDAVWQFPDYAGLGVFHRTGYKEVDLVDYNSRNLKANTALYWRLKPSEQEQSPELITAFNYGNGTTVYQGDNRFSLRNIQYFQGRIELKKRDKYFLRAYTTHENSGDSYDPYFTALLLQERQKSVTGWKSEYERYWRRNNIYGQMIAAGFPSNPFADSLKGRQWLDNNVDLMAKFHAAAANAANTANNLNGKPTLVPGTQAFQDSFNIIVGNQTNVRRGANAGAGFYDKSALYHIQGEYKFAPTWVDELTVGGNGRLYTPISNGTIFSDSIEKITNLEYGVYGGVTKKINGERLSVSATVRLDKNENFPFLVSPAASMVWHPDTFNFIRLAVSSAIRNPTLSDQYLSLNVGRAILSGNITGQQNLYTVESFTDYLNKGRDSRLLRKFSLNPISPEKVKTIEAGYRTTIGGQLYVDMGAYFSLYNDFIGYKVGIRSVFDPATGFPNADSTQAYRYATNSKNAVTTNGASISLDYYFAKSYKIAGNYSWNRINSSVNDSIIPAYNTPEHKFNLSVSGRDVKVKLGSKSYDQLGFAINYKWVQGFVFEGSPQFSGYIPTYGLLDAQVSFGMKKINSILKIGASNILENKHYETYGGPLIGRLAYISWLYDFNKTSRSSR
jgi:iron complex outermembrane recepter protein